MWIYTHKKWLILYLFAQINTGNVFEYIMMHTGTPGTLSVLLVIRIADQLLKVMSEKISNDRGYYHRALHHWDIVEEVIFTCAFCVCYTKTFSCQNDLKKEWIGLSFLKKSVEDFLTSIVITIGGTLMPINTNLFSLSVLPWTFLAQFL